MTKYRPIQLDDQQLAETLEDTQVQETLDVGVAIVHCGAHPIHGLITLISTFSGLNAMVIAAA